MNKKQVQKLTEKNAAHDDLQMLLRSIAVRPSHQIVAQAVKTAILELKSIQQHLGPAPTEAKLISAASVIQLALISMGKQHLWSEAFNGD